MREVVWSYDLEEGGRLVLYDIPDAYVLYEYDANGHVVGGSYFEDETEVFYTEVYYPKDKFTLDRAIATVEKEYFI